MKRVLIFAAMGLLSMTVFAQQEAVLHFNLKNLQKTDTLTLSWGANNKSMTPLITVLPAEATKEVTLPLNEPRVVILNLKGQTTNGLELLIAPGENVTVSGKVRNLSRSILEKLKVKGAVYQYDYSNSIAKYKEECDSLEESIEYEYRDVYRLIAQSKSKKDEQAIADMYQTEHGKKYIEQIISNFKQRGEMLNRVIDAHKATFMGPLLMIRLIGRLGKDYRDMYNALSPEAKQSYYGREVKDEVYPPTLVGDIAPTVTVKNLKDEDKVLSFTRHGNRFLLLDFWASWCEPCHKEIPNLKAIYEKYHSQGLDIISISADHSPEDWKSTLEVLNEPWCNYIDQNRQAISEYKVQYIPSIFIIDTNGKIIAEKLRGKELADFIDNLFGAATTQETSIATAK